MRNFISMISNSTNAIFRIVVDVDVVVSDMVAAAARCMHSLMRLGLQGSQPLRESRQHWPAHSWATVTPMPQYVAAYRGKPVGKYGG